MSSDDPDAAFDVGRDLRRPASSSGCSSSAGRADVIINVNFPARPADEVTEVEVTRQGFRDVRTSLRREAHRPARPRLLLAGLHRRAVDAGARAPTCAAVYDGRISVTPLHIDLTHMETVHALKGVGGRRAAKASGEGMTKKPKEPDEKDTQRGAAGPGPALAGRHRSGGAGGHRDAPRATSSRPTCSRSGPGRIRPCRSPAARPSASRSSSA